MTPPKNTAKPARFGRSVLPKQQRVAKVAAISGASSGIGRALAASMALRGFDLGLADIDSAGLDETARSLANTGSKVLTTKVDVADSSAVKEWAGEVVASFGQVNWLFNNAGVTVFDSAEHITEANFRWLMDVNFWGVVHGTQAFLPFLKSVDDARIINTSSIFGALSVPGQAAYNASKFAVRGYTESIQQELKEQNIKVTCVMPGGVKTSIVDNAKYYPTSNEAPTHEEASDNFARIAQLLPREAAGQIMEGLDHDKAQILVGMDAKMLAALQRILPVHYPKALKWLTAFLQETGQRP